MCSGEKLPHATPLKRDLDGLNIVDYVTSYSQMDSALIIMILNMNGKFKTEICWILIRKPCLNFNSKVRILNRMKFNFISCQTQFKRVINVNLVLFWVRIMVIINILI